MEANKSDFNFIKGLFISDFVVNYDKLLWIFNNQKLWMVCFFFSILAFELWVDGLSRGQNIYYLNKLKILLNKLHNRII